MVVGCRLYWVPCNECRRLISWIMFSLYYFFLPVNCIDIPYGYAGYKLCTYKFMRVYARMGPKSLRV